jgi:hypothetical protein
MIAAMALAAEQRDTVKELRAEVERLRTALKECSDDLAHANIRSRCSRGVPMKDYSDIDRGELIEEIYRKDAEVERLRAALDELDAAPLDGWGQITSCNMSGPR